MRSNNSLAPRFGTFFSRPNGIVKLLIFLRPASFTPYEQFIKLFFDECRQKILNGNRLAVAAWIALLTRGSPIDVQIFPDDRPAVAQWLDAPLELIALDSTSSNTP
jgi:hypothetical protein